LLVGQGRLDDAADQLRRLLQKNANHPRAHLGLARLASLRGDLNEATEHLVHSASDPRTQKESLALSIEINQRRGKTIAADRERRQVEELPKDPPWPDPFMDEVFYLRTGKQAAIDRATKLLAQGRPDEAQALLQETVRDYPQSDWGWYLLGKALILRGDWGRAERALTRAVQLTPESAEIQHFL